MQRARLTAVLNTRSVVMHKRPYLNKHPGHRGSISDAADGDWPTTVLEQAASASCASCSLVTRIKRKEIHQLLQSSKIRDGRVVPRIPYVAWPQEHSNYLFFLLVPRAQGYENAEKDCVYLVRRVLRMANIIITRSPCSSPEINGNKTIFPATMCPGMA